MEQNQGRIQKARDKGYVTITKYAEYLYESIDIRLHLFGCLLGSKANCTVGFEGLHHRHLDFLHQGKTAAVSDILPIGTEAFHSEEFAAPPAMSAELPAELTLPPCPRPPPPHCRLHQAAKKHTAAC